jgi:hypothetical protein
MLHAQEDQTGEKKLVYSCKRCGFQKDSTEYSVYKNDLVFGG